MASALKHVSPSQVKTFQSCQRLWYYNSVLKQRSPQTDAQSRGTIVHAALEAYLKGGTIPADMIARAQELKITEKDLHEYVEAIKPFVGKPGEGLTEYADEMPTYEGGPNFRLVVDHARETTFESAQGAEIIPQIDDLKTTSDFRYCKTPDQLSHDVQMISYAKWALHVIPTEVYPPNFVSLRHIYVRTRGKRVGTARDVLVTPAEVEERWLLILDTVREMEALAASAPAGPQDVPASTTDHCSAYGGCYFRSNCFGSVYSDSRPFNALFTKEKDTVMTTTPSAPRMSLADRVAAAKLAAEGATPGATLIVHKGVVTEAAPTAAAAGHNVLPPDAGPRTSTAAEVEAANAPKKRGRPPGSSKSTEPSSASQGAGQPVAEPTMEAAMAAAAATPMLPRPPQMSASSARQITGASRDLTLYVDCVPVKGNSNFTVGEDIIASLAEAAAKAANVPDWRLIEYGKGKGAMAAILRERITSMPDTVVITSSTPGSDVLLEVLSPHARVIVRGLRG